MTSRVISDPLRNGHYCRFLLISFAGLMLFIMTNPAATRKDNGKTPPAEVLNGEMAELRTLILDQKKALEELRARFDEQQTVINKQQAMLDVLHQRQGLTLVAKASGLQGTSVVEDTPATSALTPVQVAMTQAPAAPAALVAEKEEKKEEKPVASALSVAGFKFSGDFRYRLDVQTRSSNDIAGPLQNIRSRYRVRMNVDKEIDPRFKFHLQLSTGPYSNDITNDQDYAGIAVKHPLSIAEAYMDFHPHTNFSIRGGRMEEVFADNMRFLWDDDVRFNGFQQVAKLPINSNNSLEFRAGEYWLTNPNVVVLSANSPLVSAGYQPGQKVRDSNLFHPGAILSLSNGGAWKHKLSADAQIYRNPNQIQLASLSSGFPILVSNAIGLALSGPLGGIGNATTTAGGAIFTAANFHIVRTSYRIEHKGVKVGGKEMPLWFDFQASRNYGTSFLRDAVMGSVNLGAVKKTGDVRFLYQYAIKDGNSLISQFTDDDLGTGSGVNIAVHALRFDVGLTRFFQWQNLFFLQNERRGSNPNEFFFVPLQRGANTTFRYLGQLAFTF
jgi:hypothetical protein